MAEKHKLVNNNFWAGTRKKGTDVKLGKLFEKFAFQMDLLFLKIARKKQNVYNPKPGDCNNTMVI